MISNFLIFGYQYVVHTSVHTHAGAHTHTHVAIYIYIYIYLYIYIYIMKKFDKKGCYEKMV